MRRFLLHLLSIWMVAQLFLSASCRQAPKEAVDPTLSHSLREYVLKHDSSTWTVLDTIPGENQTTYVLKLVSQQWLTKAEVKDPVWWHWITVVVPDSVQSQTGMVFIDGGSRREAQPDHAGEGFVAMALNSHSIVADLRNVPNQPVEFVGDTFGPRVEDELIAYGWRKFLEGGAKDSDIRWLARMPMTTAAVRAMDAIQEFSQTLGKPVQHFVVAGASKRGWTTWTTGMTDDRVVAIAPIVIDLLNLQPSFQHHWQVYGQWAPAVGNYVQEGIMEWQGSQEYERMLALTEPYSLRHERNIPKFLINATGDQFFLPDSWQFYWDSLPGEKYLRYVPNSEHSMGQTDAWSTLMAFYRMIVEQKPRPEWSWSVDQGTIRIQTKPGQEPASMTLWTAHNPRNRNFQVDSIGRAYQPTDIPLRPDGAYTIRVEPPQEGYSAFFVELMYGEYENLPLKVTTGVVITPDTYPYKPYVNPDPQGTR